MKTSKWFLPLCALLAAGCAPSVYNLGFEARQPSRSGLDLARKSIAVVYSDEARSDTAFSYKFAESFATSLEKDYFGGARSIGIYSLDLSQGDYSQRDSMVSLVMQTGADVVFVLDSPEREASVVSGTQTVSPVKIRMQVYDSMSGDKDKVRSFNGTVNLQGDTVLSDKASYLGTQASQSFLSTWKEEEYGLYYYDSMGEEWIGALRYAADFKWKEAISLWMKLLDTKNPERKACAEYNIATGCFLMEDSALAVKWLDRADKDCPLSLSATLRKRIQQRAR